MVKMNNETKPGIKTTEFWMTMLTNVIAIISTLKGAISPEKMIVITAVLNGLYTLLRSLIKQPDITTIVKKNND